jgi:hypothetical protein
VKLTHSFRLDRTELSRRLERDPKLSKISVVSVDPGAMPTHLARRGSFYLRVIIMKMVMPWLAAVSVYFDPNGALRTTSKSANDLMRASGLVEQGATVAEVQPGKLVYLNGTDKAELGKEAQDETNAKVLWKYSLSAAQIKSGDTVLADWQ